MNRKTILAIAIFLLISVFAITAFAQSNPRTVTEDTYYDIFVASDYVAGSENYVKVEGSETACNLTKATLLKWDLSDVDDAATLGSVTMTLHTIATSTGTTDQSVLALYEAPDNWTESSTQGSLPTPPDHNTATPLATASGPFPVGGNVEFQVTGTSDPLVQYIQSQITGDNIASFWVEIKDGCPGGGTGRVYWNSREGGTSTLELFDTNAVTLSSFSANNGQINWPLIAALVALVAVVVAGITYGVKRTQQS